ncbi:MAG: thiopurine S-methyltransferase, partial [Granulosicoccus sp.]
WHKLQLAPGSSVLVPLCGDSPDMQWLLDAGHFVIGGDLNEQALLNFLTRHDLAYQRIEYSGLIELRGERIKLFAGDFMALGLEHTGVISGFYDRAATIALPYVMRRNYANHLIDLVGEAGAGLLISIDYDQSEMNGPPFSVPADSIQALYGRAFTLETAGQDDGPDVLGSLRDRGVSALVESAFVCRAPGCIAQKEQLV